MDKVNETQSNQGIIGNINDAIDLNEILFDPKTRLEIFNVSSGYSIVYKVTSFILGYEREFLIKVMITIEDHITPQYGLDLYDPGGEGNGTNKRLTRLSAFETEGGLQCDAYIKTACEITDKHGNIIGNNAVCPRVLNLSWYDHAKSIELMNSLTANQKYKRSLEYSFNWFMDNISPLNKLIPRNKFSIGIVAMDIVKDIVKSSEIKSNDQVYYRILAKILMLFVRLSKIHLDLHFDNVLYTKKDAYVIDYGRIFFFEKLLDNNLDATAVDLHNRFTRGTFIENYNAIVLEDKNSFVEFLHNSYEPMGDITTDINTLVVHLNDIRAKLVIDTYSDDEKIEMIKQIFYFMIITDDIYHRDRLPVNRHLFDILSETPDVTELDKHFGKILEQFKSISRTCGQIDNDSKVCGLTQHCDPLTGICYYAHELKKYFGWVRGGRKKSIKLRRHARHNKTHIVCRKGGRRKRSRRRGD